MIPVIDWSRFETDKTGVAAEIGAACRDVGFFLLAGHGISRGLRDRVFEMSDRFFALPEADKERISILNTPHFRGWGKEGDESLDETSPLVDRKETFNVGYDLAPDDPRVVAGEMFRGVNQWPEIDGFRETLLDYYDAGRGLGVDVLRAIALDLGLDEFHFTGLFQEPMTALRLLHYPPASGETNEIGAGAHTDYGAITLLLTDGEAGLQVRPRDGDWMDVPHLEDAFVVNIGDCLMRWTNDLYVSTPHRVLPPERIRRSVALFVEANPDAIVAALPGTGTPKYPAIRAADYLMSRLDATYAPKAAQ